MYLWWIHCEKSEHWNGSPIYRVVTIKEMSERLCESTHFTIQSKTEVPSKNGTSTIIVKPTTIKFSPMNYLREGEDDAYPLARYHDVALMSRTEGVISLYIPPKHKDASDEFALKFINQMRTRFYNPEAFIEELKAHAYRFRHPDAHIEELFIHCSSEGKTGKTTLSEVFDSLYPNLSMIGIKAKEASSSFDGWMTDYLNLCFEELESEAYKNKFFETFVKQITSKKTSVRKLYQNTTSGEYKCIVSLNTNSDDLYGLIRADGATTERLVILHFKPAVSVEEANAFEREFGLDESADDYQERKNLLAASLYHYLRYTMPLPRDYRAKRYYGEDKFTIIQQLRAASCRVPMRFLKALTISPLKRKRGEHWNEILQERTCSGVKQIFVPESDLESSFAKYLTSNVNSKERSMYSITSVIDDLTRTLGWTPKRYDHNSVAGYQIPMDSFISWSKGNDESTDTEDEDSELEIDEAMEAINATTIQKKRSCSPQ